MKKFILFLNTVALLLFLLAVPVAASGVQIDEHGELTDKYIEQITDNLDRESKEILTSFGLNELSSEELMKLSVSDIFKSITDIFYISIKDQLYNFFRMLGMLIVMIIANSIRNSRQQLSAQVTDVFSMLCIIMIASSINSCISGMANAFSLTGKLLYSYTPVLTVFLSISGNVTSSILYNSTVVAVSQVLSAVSENIIIPFICVYFALITALSLNETVNTDKITSSINKAVITLVSAMTMIFTVLISGKNILAKEIDGIAYTSGRYFISNFIPVIGPSVSSILSSIIGSLSLVKSTVAIVAILCAAAINLPIIAKLFANYLSLHIIGIIADSFGEKRAGSIFAGFSSGIRILMIIVIFELVMVIIATGLVLTIKGGI
ncbi:MAG: hypothetical protein E7558_06755 [Ruminococcaceae bacterium]|nr:hypothetical protein [Oscillospiraceae bacterium]